VFIGLLNADTSFPDFLLVHCIIHREHLGAKYFQYPHIMQVVLNIVNCIRSSAKTHRQFKSFIENMNNDELPDGNLVTFLVILVLLSEMTINKQCSWQIF